MFIHKMSDDLHLKPMEMRDAEPMFTLIDTTRSYMREWLPWVDGNVSVEDSRTFIQSTLNQVGSNQGFQAGIWYQEQFVGAIGLHGVDWRNRSASIGYWLGQPYQGQGVMTRACRAVIDIVFGEYELNRVEIRAAVDNVRSRAIPERLGFRQEGCIRQAERLHDRYVDHVVYGLLAEEWSGNV